MSERDMGVTVRMELFMLQVHEFDIWERKKKTLFHY